MLSIQYLLFTPKCVSCSKVEIFTHSWTRYTVSKTPQKHEDERNYCISFRQSYFQHWSINVWSLNEWTLWPIQRNMTKKKDWSLIEENLGLATRFPQVRAALARSPNLEAIEDILKEKGCQRSSHQGRCQFRLSNPVTQFQSCQGSSRQWHSEAARGNSIAVKMS